MKIFSIDPSTGRDGLLASDDQFEISTLDTLNLVNLGSTRVDHLYLFSAGPLKILHVLSAQFLISGRSVSYIFLWE